MIIAICDGETNERKNCRYQIDQLAKLHQIDLEIRIYQKWEELLFHMDDERRSPDAIYLNLDLEHTDETLITRRLREHGFQGDILFFNEKQGFLLSAFNKEGFFQVLRALTPELIFEEVFLQVVKAAGDRKERYIRCNFAGEYCSIEIRSIRYFKIVKRIVTVYYERDREFSYYSSFSRLHDQLRDQGFVRTHRAYLVALASIHKLSYTELTLYSGEVLPVGRSYHTEIRRRMKEM